MSAITDTMLPSGQFANPIEKWSRHAALAMLIVVLAWAPFPLGSAVNWGAPALEIMIGVAWLFWSVSLIAGWDEILTALRPVAVPVIAIVAVLVWSAMQSLPITPAAWAHPLWRMTADVLNQPVAGTVSIDPWRTQSAVLKLASYAAVFWIALCISGRSATAKFLLNAIVAITAIYALYGFALAFLDLAQAQLIYAVPFKRTFISGPFMLHNSFATFEGLGTLAAILKLFDDGRESIISHRGLKQLGLTSLQFAFGRGAPALIAALLSFAAVVASASRAGFVATAGALLAMALISVLLARRSSVRGWTLIAVGGVVAAIFLSLMLGGDTLGDRLVQLVDAGNADEIRLALWGAASRMISSAPWQGLGLGTFQDAYPLYAQQALAFVMDKAHCDYLEFAAGVGLPAAILWWSALAWLALRCLHGVFIRRRNRQFALLGFCATVLVGLHSAVDFSLQLPAVGVLYAAMLGLGVAQAQRTVQHAWGAISIQSVNGPSGMPVS